MKKLLMAALAALTLTACGEHVQVPPAFVGKILTKNGYAPDTIPPSKFRLAPCFAYCDSLVLLEAADTGYYEQLVLFMPKDKLNLVVDLRGTLTVPTTPSVVNAIYDRVTAATYDGSDAHKIITSQKIYSTYGQQALRGVVRSELVKYTISEILANRESIGQSIHAALADKLKATNTPIIVSRFELADIQPPKVIVDAQQATKEREIAVQRAEADAEVAIVESEKALLIAQKDRLVEKEKALAIAESNRIAAASITPQLLAYRKLETAERIYTELAKSNNTIIVPADSSGFSDITGDAVLAKMLGKEMKR